MSAEPQLVPQVVAARAPSVLVHIVVFLAAAGAAFFAYTLIV